MSKEKQLHRLEDIETEEVSIVDRAANKRKFLVVKRSGDMGPQLKKNEDGTFSIVDQDGKPVTIRMKAEWRDSIVGVAADALERLTNIVEMAKGAEESDGDDLVFPEEIAKEILSIAESIHGLPAQVGAKKSDPDPNGDQNANPGDDGSTDVNKAGDGKDGKWLRALKEVFEQLKAATEELKRAPGGAPNTGGPNVGSGTQPDAASITTAANAFRDVPGLGDLLKATEDLTKAAGEIAGLKDTVAKQAAELQDLRAGIDTASSRQPTAKSDQVDDGEVAWPRDMNKESRWED